MTTDLHARALELSLTYKKTEVELIDILQRIDKTRLYLRLGYSSLFNYCVKALGLSESTTYNFITVARKAIEVPQLKEAIESGLVSVSKAKKISSVITKESQTDWINKATTLSSRELEREVVKVSPKEETPEKIKYVREDRVNLNLGLSEGLLNKLKRVQDLESQRTAKPVTFEEAITALIDLYLERKDPVERAKRFEKSRSQLVTGTVFKDGASKKALLEDLNFGNGESSFPKRMHIPTKTKHQVYLRDQGKCTFDNCNNQRWIEIHHVKPVSQGGSNALNNLTTLCSSHHKMVHGN